jgi:UV DNA damage repair endonuclease
MKTNTRANYKKVDRKTGELAVLTIMRHNKKKWWHAYEFINPKDIKGTYRYPARISDLAKNRPDIIETIVDTECARMSLYRLIK